jgi:hypothetical protein
MSRDDAFGRADIDVGLFDDIKVKRLWRLLNDPAKMHHAMILYISAILASWAEAEPASLVDGAPIWTDVPEEIVAALVAVELVDGDGRIKSDSFDRWFSPALERRSRRQAASAIANATRWGKQTDRSPTGVRTESPTSRQTNIHGRAPATGGSGRARENGEVAETPREAGETLKAYLNRIGAPIPDLATTKETTSGENGPEGRSDDDGQSRPKPRRRTKATG